MFWGVCMASPNGPTTLMKRSTEPNTGLETLKLRTEAVKDGDMYRISGQKM